MKKKKNIGKGVKKLFKKTGIIIAKLILLFIILSTIQVVLLKWIAPFTSAVIIQRQFESFFSGKDVINFEWYDYDEISKKFALAVIASEDQNFPMHIGFDLEQIDKAIKERKERGRLRGASTITQQVAKNLFLWENQSFIRKGLEAYYTILLESFWGKRRILEMYMNIAETGDNFFGIGIAAKRYFNKTPSKLSGEECALIASVLPNPARFSVLIPSAYILRRQQWILHQMKSLGGTSYIEDL